MSRLAWPQSTGVPAVGVIGWPVEHSLSPAIHNAAFGHLGMKWRYVLLPVPPGSMKQAAKRLVRDGYRGANVTMPHKTVAWELCDHRSEDSDRTRAVNTIVIDRGTLSGSNTDVPGFIDFVKHQTGFDARGKAAIVFGGGGAARACGLALAKLGAGSIAFALRDPAKRAPIEATLEGLSPNTSFHSFDSAAELSAEIVVNATPLGSAGERLPLPGLSAGSLAVDLVYHPPETPFVLEARRNGASAFGGLGMLVRQAALSFRVWTGTDAPLEVMREAAEKAL